MTCIQVYVVYYIIVCQMILATIYICNDAWSLTRKTNNKIALAITNAFVFVPIGPLPPSSGPFYCSIQWLNFKDVIEAPWDFLYNKNFCHETGFVLLI